MDRYAGNSKQLPAHTNIDDSIYGSLSVYQQEIIDQLSLWVTNNSLAEMDSVVQSTIKNTSNVTHYTEVWNEIKERLTL